MNDFEHLKRVQEFISIAFYAYYDPKDKKDFAKKFSQTFVQAIIDGFNDGAADLKADGGNGNGDFKFTPEDYAEFHAILSKELKNRI